MCNLLSHYIITLISILKHKIYNVLDYFRNNDTIWKIDENKNVKQVWDKFSIDESDFENVKFVDKNVK